MNREQKAAAITEVASQIREAQAIFAVDYRGLTVKQASELRGRLIAIDANLRVVKNTLTERAADEVGVEALKQFLNGPTAFTFVNGDPVLAAKALAAFRREANDVPSFKGGYMDGKELSIEDIEGLSRLPSLEVMHGQLVGMIASPLTGLARSMNAILSGIAIALGQISEQGLLAGNAAPAVEPAADAPAEAASADAPTADGDDAPAAEAEAAATDAPAETASADAADAPAAEGDEAAAAPAEAASADATDAPANDGDEAAAAEADAPAAEAPVADADAPAAEADAPAADADAPPPADSEAPDATNAADAADGDATPTAPEDAPQPEAAEEIPNQPMPDPAADAGDSTETSNEEGDN